MYWSQTGIVFVALPSTASQTHAPQHPRGTYLRLTTSAPIVESGTIGLATARFNGSFLGESIFRREASPEVDAAWESLGVDCQSQPPRLRGLLSLARDSCLCMNDADLKITDRPSVVSEAYAELSGIRPSHVRVSPEHGGGFIANVEGLHHLHCLVRGPISSGALSSLAFVRPPCCSSASFLRLDFI